MSRPPPSRPSNWPSFPILFIFAASAVLYLLNFSRTYVGFYYDDADYVLGALSLLRGRYALLRLPWQPLIDYRWPGFPIVLAPFAAMLQPHWALLKIIPFFIVLVCVYLFFRWTRRRFNPRVALGVTALFAFNPQTVERAQAVMAEPLFLALLLGMLCLLEGFKEKRSRLWWVGLLAAYAILVRPEGVLFVGALFCALWLAEGIVLASPVIVPTVILAGGYLLMHWIGHAPAPGHWSEWWRNISLLSAPDVLRHALSQLVTLIVGVVVPLPLPQSLFAFGFGAALTLIVLGMLCTGAISTLENKPFKLENWTLIFFIVGYVVFHGLWFAVNRRYFWPLLPFILEWAVFALMAVSASWKKAAIALSLGLVFVSYGWGTLTGFRDTLYPAPSARLPLRSLGWIQSQTGLMELILTNNPSMVYLYTGHLSIGLQPALLTDAAAFINVCETEGISEVVYTPLPPVNANLPATEQAMAQWKRSPQWLLLRDYAFEKRYAFSEEGVLIFRVKPLPAYPQAYSLYLSALEDVQNRRPVWAAAKIKEVLREEPNFPEADYLQRLLASAAN